MKALVFRETAGNQVVMWLVDEPAESARVHLEKTDASLLAMYEAGNLSASVEEDFMPPQTLYVPPSVAAGRETEAIHAALLRKAGKALFAIVNDIRQRHGDQPLTLQEFRNWVQGL